jgi:polyribonucleotide nucleotidyltransferase
VKHWGIETNVSGLTAAKFDAKIRRINREQVKAAKAKAKADRIAAMYPTEDTAAHLADERQDRNRQSLGQRLGGLWKGKFEA